MFKFFFELKQKLNCGIKLNALNKVIKQNIKLNIINNLNLI